MIKQQVVILRKIVMPFNKEAILHLSAEEKRQLAFELLDSIDEEYLMEPLPVWKKQLIRQRLDSDRANPSDVFAWDELRKKYVDK